MTKKSSKALHLVGKAVRIISAVDGFRRAGVAHGKAPTDHPADAFNEEQLEALEAEPNLTVLAIEGQDKADPIAELLKGKVDDVVARIVEASDEVRAEALKVEQAKGDKARKGVLKALGAEE